MNRHVAYTAVAALVLGTAIPALANSLVLTNPAGYADPSEAQPVPTNSQAFIGSGSWQAPGSGGKSEIYLTPTELGLSAPITIDQIQSMSWAVNSPHNVDWYLTVYTDHSATGINEATWYQNRLTFEGLYAKNLNTPANSWVTFSTNSGTNQVTADDSQLTGNFGTYNQPTLQQLQGGSIDWSSYGGATSTSIDYRNQTVKYFVLSTGSAWANGYTGYLDDFNVTLTSGSSATVDFEAAAAPLPSAAGMGIASLGMAAAGILLRRKLRLA